MNEINFRKQKKLQTESLFEFIRYYWHVLEPVTKFQDGWCFKAICEHLEAVADGNIKKILINVPPGFSKSLITNVFWPAWLWGPKDQAHLRFISFSYAAHLTERDNAKFRDLIRSKEYQEFWGDRVQLTEDGKVKVANSKTGWRFASSIGGVGTGERADVIVCLKSSTQLETNKGKIAIGEIVKNKLNVKVLGRNDADGSLRWQTIEAHEANPTRALLEIEFSNGSRLCCTKDHPIWIAGRGYCAAETIREGQEALCVVAVPDVRRSLFAVFQSLFSQMRIRLQEATEHSAVFGVWKERLSVCWPLGKIQNRQAVLQSQMSNAWQSGKWQSKVEGRQGKTFLSSMWEGLRRSFVYVPTKEILFYEVCSGIGLGFGSILSKEGKKSALQDLWQAFQTCKSSNEILFGRLQACGAFSNGKGNEQRSLCSWEGNYTLWHWLDRETKKVCQSARQLLLFLMQRTAIGKDWDTARSSYRLQQRQSPTKQSSFTLSLLSWKDAWQVRRKGKVEAVLVKSIREVFEEPTFNVRVGPDHNYFANDILVHNCDDAHNIKEAESEIIRTETVRWTRESMSNRLNSMSEGKIVAIMQRSHSDDVSNLLMDLDYEHLMVPMEYDPSRHCQTSIGWEDPRTEEGELAWPERFPQEVVQDIRKTIGPYAYSSQYQQAPTIRGGAIIKREYWQPYITEDGKVPPMSHIVASLDPAYTAKQQNDPSGFTVWGLWHDANGHSKFMCLNAWRKRLELHGPTIDRKVGETDAEYNQRTQKFWGLCEWVAYSCRRFRVDKLLIENKASGLSVAQEIRRLYRHEGWMVQTVDPGGDKIARANAVQALFADEQIYLPAYSDGAFRDWGEMLVAECEAFPKGSTDDLVDSTTQAMKYFRDNNMALRRNERNTYMEEQRKHVQHNVVPLYPA